MRKKRWSEKKDNRSANQEQGLGVSEQRRREREEQKRMGVVKERDW